MIMASSTGTRTHSAAIPRSNAAIFIDFESLQHFLQGQLGDLPDMNRYIIDMLRNLQRQLERRQGMQSIIMKAYADFERVAGRPQGWLYLPRRRLEQHPAAPRSDQAHPTSKVLH